MHTIHYFMLVGIVIVIFLIRREDRRGKQLDELLRQDELEYQRKRAERAASK